MYFLDKALKIYTIFFFFPIHRTCDSYEKLFFDIDTTETFDRKSTKNYSYFLQPNRTLISTLAKKDQSGQQSDPVRNFRNIKLSKRNDFLLQKVTLVWKQIFLLEMASYAYEASCLYQKSDSIALGIYAKVSPSYYDMRLEDGLHSAIITRIKGREMNIQQLRNHMSKDESPYKGVRNAFIRSYIYSDEIRNGLDKILNQVIAYAEAKSSRKEVFMFTGHGEGGVFAVLVALSFKLRFREKRIEVATFGQPRFANRKFIKYLESKLYIHRVTYADDYVPTILQYNQVHHNTEYWIPFDKDCSCEDIQFFKIPRDIYECRARTGEENWTLFLQIIAELTMDLILGL
ncbi:hypothetical protein G9A89_001579 [Geosiphon pyriformis]|nr:hypothetical protein G9A89_001579 [Geosiphon pyriformis]